MAMTSALSALSSPSRATSSPMVTRSGAGDVQGVLSILTCARSGHDMAPGQTLTRSVSSPTLDLYQLGRVGTSIQPGVAMSNGTRRPVFHQHGGRDAGHASRRRCASTSGSGLIQPTRTVGSMRLYAREELERLRLIKHLVDELGINLAGVQRLLADGGSDAAHSAADGRARAEHRRRPPAAAERDAALNESLGL